MSRHNFHTTCTLPILAQQLSRICTHAQTPRRNVMAYIRHLRGWRRAIMARALPWAGIPCSPCTVGTRPKILVGPIPAHRNHWFSWVWEWMEHGGLHISVYRKLPNVAGSGARRKPGRSRRIEIIGSLEFGNGWSMEGSTYPCIGNSRMCIGKSRRNPDAGSGARRVGTRPKIPVALYRGYEAPDRRFPCARVLAANEREQFEFELVRAAAGL